MHNDQPRKTLYFAHSTGTYGTKAEERGVNYIKKLFPQYDIINPASPLYQPLIQRDASYEEKLVRSCNCLVYLPFSDGTIDAAIAKNITNMLRMRREVHELHVTEKGVPNGMCSHISKLDTDRTLNTEDSTSRNHEAAALLNRPERNRL
jgi:hypothetical protein